MNKMATPGGDSETTIQALKEEISRLKSENESIRESEKRYRALFEALPVSLEVVDREGTILEVNPFHLAHMGGGHTTQEDYRGKDIGTRKSIVASGLAGDIMAVLDGIPFEANEVRFPNLSGGGEGWFNVRGVPLKKDTEIIGAIYISEDVTVLKKARDELTLHKDRLEELVETRTADLREALKNVKTLSGLIPICASCKKVRDDTGYWNQLEAYLAMHSGMEFSHSLCPECTRRLYPDIHADGL